MKKLFAMATTEFVLMQSKLRKIASDKSGATMIEYSVLVGLITAAVIVTIGLVALWVAGAWTTLNTALGPVPTP